MLLFITLSASILFPPISIFAAFNPLVGGRRRVGWYGPLVANLHGGDSAFSYKASDIAGI
jgi:hypothetical protein